MHTNCPSIQENHSQASFTAGRLDHRKGGYMHGFTRNATIFLLVAALLLLPMAVARAQDPLDEKEITGSMMVADLLLMRPVGFVATVIGGAAFLISLPFSAAGGNMDAAADMMVGAPARFTFYRALGDF
jgi:hypothetical protein